MLNSKNSSNAHASQAWLGTSRPSALTLGVSSGAAMIAIAAILAYLPSLSGGFIFDDDIYLTNNQIIKASDGLCRFWCTTEPIDYYPISNTTLWIEWRLWGMNPTGYHATNLILHIVESLLIWVILRKLSIPGAFLGAMIFAVHPVNVESVAWIAQRKDMMAILFFLLSILCYIKHNSSTYNDGAQGSRRTPDAGPAHGACGLLTDRWYWLSLAAFVLAMLSKGSVAVMPVLLLGIVWWLRPLTRWDLVRIAPFFVITLVLGGVNVWFQTHGTGEEFRTASFMQRLLGAGGVVWFYLYTALLPINLAFVYPQWNIQAGNPLWWLPLPAAVAVTAVLWRYRESWSRPLLFAWGFFCVALAPVMGFTDVGYMRFSLVADHYQHIAIIGVIALVSAVWSVWHQRARGGAHWTATFVAVAAVGALTFLSWRQSGLFCDAITLYRATLDKNPGCWMAQNNLGNEFLHKGRVQEAIEHYERALQLKPDFPDANYNLGNQLLNKGGVQEAIEHYQQALRLMPDYIEAHNNLSAALLQTGRPWEAIEHFKEVLRLKPDFTVVYYHLALAYAMAQQSSEAIAAAGNALELARSQGQTALAKRIEDWLNSYREGLSDLPNTPPPAKPITSPP